MRIERISDNQIRCTLSKRDLIERQIKISELAYGSERAKELFRDMMEQANIDFGFDTEDIPLMIEAIPTSRESLVLVITKVDNPQEFDEKFANFNLPGEEIVSDNDDFGEVAVDGTDQTSLSFDELLKCFDQIYEKNVGEARVRKYYHLTQKGTDYLAERERDWHIFSTAVQGVLGGDGCVLA